MATYQNLNIGGLQGGLLGLGGRFNTPITTTVSNALNAANILQWSSGMNNITLGLPTQLQVTPITPKPEDEIAWLRRRVREVLWQP